MRRARRARREGPFDFYASIILAMFILAVLGFLGIGVLVLIKMVTT